MAVPKKKMSRSRTRRRKATWKVSAPHTIPCDRCGAPHLPHHWCANCRTYKSREIYAAE